MKRKRTFFASKLAKGAHVTYRPHYMIQELEERIQNLISEKLEVENSLYDRSLEIAAFKEEKKVTQTNRN